MRISDWSSDVCSSDLGGELAALVGVEDFWATIALDRLVQRLDAEPGVQGLGEAPGQHLAAPPVHDRHQLQEALGCTIKTLHQTPISSCCRHRCTRSPRKAGCVAPGSASICVRCVTPCYRYCLVFVLFFSFLFVLFSLFFFFFFFFFFF